MLCRYPTMGTAKNKAAKPKKYNAKDGNISEAEPLQGVEEGNEGS